MFAHYSQLPRSVASVRRGGKTSGQRHTIQKVCEIHSSQAAEEVKNPQVVPALFVLVRDVSKPRLAKAPCGSESWKSPRTVMKPDL